VRRIREFLTRRAPQREACDLLLVAQRAATLLLRDLRAAEVQLQWRFAARVPTVFADPILLEQVLINLLRNAADAMADMPASTIRITAQLSGERFVRMDVEDSGPGLAGRTVDALSAPFYSTKSDGMGMGLAICRSIIEVHHGGMDAGSSSLGGARFSFTLPVFDAERQALSLEDEDARASLESGW
jgi:two-component system sensor histidine kinase DctS